MRSGWKHCAMWVASALRKVGEGEHPSPGGGSEVPHAIAPRRQLRMDSHMPHPPTCLEDVHTE